jgi:hypothetical protein
MTTHRRFKHPKLRSEVEQFISDHKRFTTQEVMTALNLRISSRVVGNIISKYATSYENGMFWVRRDE